MLDCFTHVRCIRHLVEELIRVVRLGLKVLRPGLIVFRLDLRLPNGPHRRHLNFLGGGGHHSDTALQTGDPFFPLGAYHSGGYLLAGGSFLPFSRLKSGGDLRTGGTLPASGRLFHRVALQFGGFLLAGGCFLPFLRSLFFFCARLDDFLWRGN
jgi:hypothetical protein